MRALLRAALFLTIALVLAEGTPRVVSLFARGRSTRHEGQRTILCVGDSHTYGALVSAGESYPAHLQRRLDERAPGAYSVVNLGIPGMNTRQVLEQLRSELPRYRPEVVIVWCGANNAWNRSTTSRGRRTWRARLEEWALRLRVYRFVRVWASHRSLDRLAAELGAGQRYDVIGQRDLFDQRDGAPTVVVRDGRVERIDFVGGAVSDEEFEHEAAEDYQAMLEAGRAAGARVVFVAYPVDTGAFHTANRAVRRVAERSSAAVLDTVDAVRRVPLERRQLLWGAHPNGEMYAEIAREIVPLVTDGARRADATSARLARTLLDTATGTSTGTCALTASDCAGKGSCYRWAPAGTVCNVEHALASRQTDLEASLRFRVTSLPSTRGGTDVFGMLEKSYGTGLRLEFADGDHLRVTSQGKAGASSVCGPLRAQVTPGTWYTVRVRGTKGDAGAVTLALVEDGSRTSETRSCDQMALGGGAFTHLVVGSDNRFGATADVLLTDIEVWGAGD